MRKLAITLALVISLAPLFANGTFKNSRPERRVTTEAQILKLEKKIEKTTTELNGFIAANEDWRAKEGFSHRQVKAAEQTEKLFKNEISRLEKRVEKLR
jgi:septal ring factor EnvC (AmiA/AmiB activator)